MNMAKKTETNTANIEREYIIPLRDKCRPVPRYKKTPKAVKTVKEFLAKHMKIYDRDLNKIKIDKLLNEALWFRGIKNPPHKIKVKAIKEGDIVRVELVDLSKKLEGKKRREEKRELIGEEGKKNKSLTKPKEENVKDADKVPKGMTSDDKKDGGLDVDDKIELKEKEMAVKEAGEKYEEEKEKESKHKTDAKSPKKNRIVRPKQAK